MMSMAKNDRGHSLHVHRMKAGVEHATHIMWIHPSSSAIRGVDSRGELAPEKEGRNYIACGSDRRLPSVNQPFRFSISFCPSLPKTINHKREADYSATRRRITRRQ
jgi:hypothetical protein